jgi:hypothetical protein
MSTFHQPRGAERSQCQWDFRFSAFANLLQSVFQRSSSWYRKHVVALCRARRPRRAAHATACLSA